MTVIMDDRDLVNKDGVSTRYKLPIINVYPTALREIEMSGMSLESIGRYVIDEIVRRKIVPAWTESFDKGVLIQQDLYTAPAKDERKDPEKRYYFLNAPDLLSVSIFVGEGEVPFIYQVWMTMGLPRRRYTEVIATINERGEWQLTFMSARSAKDADMDDPNQNDWEM